MKKLFQPTVKLIVAALLVFTAAFAYSAALSVVSAARPRIFADEKFFDPKTGIYHLYGNVSVEIGSRLIMADEAAVDLATQIVTAKGHIGLESETDGIKFSGDELKVNVDKNMAWVDGHVFFEQGGIIIMSDNASYCWSTRIALFENRVKLLNATEKTKTKHAFIKYSVLKKEIVEKK